MKNFIRTSSILKVFKALVGVLKAGGVIECSSCGRRPAIYFRRHSGERLCSICLHRDLVKEIKRSFSLIGKKGLGLKVAVPIVSCRFIESVVLMKLLNEVEQEFSGEVVGVVTEEELLDSITNVRRYCNDIVFIALGYEDVKKSIDVFKAFSSLGARFDVVALPATLDDILVSFLNSLVYDYEIVKPKVYAKHDGIEFIFPMHRILKTDILAYALASGILRGLSYPTCLNEPDALSRFASQLSMEHPELLYRFLYSELSQHSDSDRKVKGKT
ncbi:MAG: hypothetical protein QW459_04410 [Sulfolobales archaeon]